MAIEEQTDSEAASGLAAQVGARMRDIRKSKGMTLMEIAHECGTTPQTIQRLETANMTLSIEWVERISAALGVEPRALFGDDDALLRGLSLRKVRSNARTVRLQAMDFIEQVDEFLEKSGE